MSVRITGMNSGLDTESIIRELVSGASKKRDKTVKAQTKLEWKQEAWKGLNKKIKSFQSTISNLRFTSAFRKKTTSISNTNLATIVTGDNAVNGSQSLVVKQLAKSGYLTGGRLSENKSVKGSTTLEQLTKGTSMELGEDDKASFGVKVGGTTTYIELTGKSTIDEVVMKLNGAGVTATFDTTNQRFFISAGKSGDAGDFSLTANNVEGLKALSSLGLFTRSEVSAANSALAAAYNPGTGALNAGAADSYIKARGDSYASSMQKNLASAETLSTFFEAIRTLKDDWENNNPSKADYDAAVITYGDRDGLAAKKEILENDRKALAEKQEYVNLLNKQEALQPGETLSEAETERLDALRTQFSGASAGDMQTQIDADSADIAGRAADIETAENAFKAYDSLQDAIKTQEDAIKTAVKNAKNLNDYYEKTYGIAHEDYEGQLAAVRADVAAAVSAGTDTSELEKKQQLLETMIANKDVYAHTEMISEYDVTFSDAESIYNKAVNEITQEAKAAHETISNADAYLAGASESAVRVKGQNAIIELNGAEFISDSNTFSVNGLTITAKSLSNVTSRDADGNPLTYEEAQITTQNDVDGLYKMIKDVLKQYNELIKEIDGLYNAEAAKGYEPLTDEEKAAMTDKEVEKWEEKVKSAVLRRDAELGSVRNMLKESLMGSFKVGGRSYSLADFGIFTQGYFEAEEDERSLLHIDGDEDDEIGAGKKNILKQMLSADPDTIGKFFNQMAGKLYDSMSYASRSLKGIRSYGSFYSDKTLTTQYDSYKKEIKKQEDKIGKMEDKYYKMFAAMESAMSKSNSTSSYLTNMFGM